MCEVKTKQYKKICKNETQQIAKVCFFLFFKLKPL